MLKWRCSSGEDEEMGISSNRYKVCFISAAGGGPRSLLCPCQLPIRHPQGLLQTSSGLLNPHLFSAGNLSFSFTEKTKPAYQEPGGSLLPSVFHPLPLVSGKHTDPLTYWSFPCSLLWGLALLGEYADPARSWLFAQLFPNRTLLQKRKHWMNIYTQM